MLYCTSLYGLFFLLQKCFVLVRGYLAEKMFQKRYIIGRSSKYPYIDLQSTANNLSNKTYLYSVPQIHQSHLNQTLTEVENIIWDLHLHAHVRANEKNTRWWHTKCAFEVKWQPWLVTWLEAEWSCRAFGSRCADLWVKCSMWQQNKRMRASAKQAAELVCFMCAVY